MEKTPYQDEISSKLVSIVYRQLPISLIAEGFIYILCFFAFLGNTNHVLLLTWFSFAMTAILFRAGVIFSYFKYNKNTNSELNKWLILLFICAALSGLSFFPIGSIFIPSELSTRQTFIIFILLGALTAGNLFYSPIKYLYLFFLIPLYFPHIVWLFLEGNIYYNIGVSALLYMFMMLFLSNYINRFTTESVRLQFDLKNVNTSLEKNEKTLLSTIENAPFGIGIMSLDGKWLAVNRVLCDMLGYTKGEMKNLTYQDLIHADDLEDAISNITNLTQGKISSFQIEKRFIRKNGLPVWATLSVSAVKDANNKPIYFVTQIQDITQRKRNQQMMEKLNAQTEKALNKLRLNESEMAIISGRNNLLQTCTNLKEAFSIINATAEQLFTKFNGAIVVYHRSTKKMKTTEQWGMTHRMKDVFDCNDCWALRQGNNYIVNDPHKNILCHHFTSKPEGGYLCIPLIVQNTLIGLLNINADPEESISSHFRNLAITFSDVFKLALMNIRLRVTLHKQAIHDPLTGLYNRRYMHKKLAGEMSKASQEKKLLYVAMLDLDYFKQFNDKHGHEAGDEVLKTLGKLLKNNFSRTDIACRFGGEEFVLVLVNTNKKAVLQRMEKLREQVKQKKLEVNGVVLPTITLSIGLAEAPTDGDTLDSIIAAADQALYAAKKAGRDRVVFFKNK